MDDLQPDRVGLSNLTLALILSAHPPDFWVGLSAGLTLLALLDGNQRFSYLRHCHLESGVLAVMLDTFIRQHLPRYRRLRSLDLIRTTGTRH